MQSVLLDTSVLLGLFYERDNRHTEAVNVMRSLKGERIIPAPVVVEVFWLLTSKRIHLDVRTRYTRAVAALETIHSKFRIEMLTPEDMTDMIGIMRNYADARFDYADVAIMAISKRLKITAVCTFDRRDFDIYTMNPVNSLTLLP